MIPCDAVAQYIKLVFAEDHQQIEISEIFIFDKSVVTGTIDASSFFNLNPPTPVPYERLRSSDTVTDEHDTCPALVYTNGNDASTIRGYTITLETPTIVNAVGVFLGATNTITSISIQTFSSALGKQPLITDTDYSKGYFLIETGDAHYSEEVEIQIGSINSTVQGLCRVVLFGPSCQDYDVVFEEDPDWKEETYDVNLLNPGSPIVINYPNVVFVSPDICAESW